MHIVLLIIGIILLVGSFVLLNKSDRIVGPARGMWSGTTGDLMSGEPFRLKKETRPVIYGGGCLTLLIAIACFVAAWKTWPTASLPIPAVPSPLRIIDAPGLVVSIRDAQDPIKLGQTLAQVIEVRNEGIDMCTGIALRVTIPPEMEFASAEGPAGEIGKAEGRSEEDKTPDPDLIFTRKQRGHETSKA